MPDAANRRRDEMNATKPKVIMLTKHEVQSGSTRQKWAEGLILQLPTDHEGRNSWLLNYGVSDEAKFIRKNHSSGVVKFDEERMAAETVN